MATANAGRAKPIRSGRAMGRTLELPASPKRPAGGDVQRMAGLSNWTRLVALQALPTYTNLSMVRGRTVRYHSGGREQGRGQAGGQNMADDGRQARRAEAGSGTGGRATAGRAGTGTMPMQTCLPIHTLPRLEAV